MLYDVIIIGSGPAGISAGLYTKRAGLKTLIISKGVGTLEKAEKIENYYGFLSQGGIELQKVGENQAENLGIEIKREEVMNISYNENFIVETLNFEYETKIVVIATGNSRKKSNIKGLKEFEGRGVSYCATCDGFFYQGKNVAVLGNREYAIHEAQNLLPIAKKVILLTNGEQLVEKRHEGIEVDENKIREFRGTNSIEQVKFEDNTIKKIDGVFIALGMASSSDLAKKIGIMLDEKENIKVNNKMETNVKGIYACGDCTGGIFQVAKAVYEGMVAGMSIIQYLKN
jgi:hypothetical protein